MADLALEACGVSVQGPERVHVKDLLGSVWIPTEAAAVIQDALAKMQEDGNVQKSNRWQALEYWAAEYLQQ
jgi:hypothetical protein